MPSEVSVRRRRRELALLKTLGLTRRQVMAAVAWQASVIPAAVPPPCPGTGGQGRSGAQALGW